MGNKQKLKFEFMRGFVAIAIAIAVAFIFIFICADDPAKALNCLLIRPIISNGALNMSSILTILGRMTPIIFTGLAVCVMFSANQFNLAGEGTVMAGGFVAALLAIYVPMAAGLHPVVCILVGAVVGGLLMLIPAIAKVKLNASEMVCSLMLNYVVLYVIMHFLSNVFADRSQGSTQTYPFLETAKVAKIVPGTELTWGFAIAIIATILVGFFMYRTRWGYTIRMIGINESFSKYSGMKVGGVIVLSQVIGGVLSGMAVPSKYWADTTHSCGKICLAMVGQVSLLPSWAKNNPLAIPFAALFIAYLNRGCELMSIYAGVPAEMIDIIQAVIFLFFAAEQFMSKTRQKMVVKETKEELAKKQQEAAVEGGNA